MTAHATTTATGPRAGDPPRFPVLAMPVSAVTPDQAAGVVAGWIARGARTYVNVCTTQTALACHDSPELARIVSDSGMAVPDGMPLVWIGRSLGFAVGRVYGPDLMLALCRNGVPAGWRHFLYGSSPAAIARLRQRLEAAFPGLAIAGAVSPPFTAPTPGDDARAAQEINAARPDIVWVGLGSPKQDYWMHRMRPMLTAPVLVGVGAAFDFHAGVLRQAPRWMMGLGLEWAFRLSQEPRRLWRRYLLGNPRFVWLWAASRVRTAIGRGAGRGGARGDGVP